MTLYWIKKVNGKKQRIWNYGRSRGLKEAKNILGDVEKEVKLLLKNKKQIKILEVGCGYGRILLELKKKYKDRVETFGINKEPRWNLKLIEVFGVAEGIFSKKEIAKNLPKLVICDVNNKIPFKNNTFDFVFSERTIQYLSNKAKYLEELNRVTTKDGTILTDIQNGTENRWEIFKKGKKVNIYSILSQKKGIKLQKEKGNPKDKFLRMQKQSNFKLNLTLVSSQDLHKLNPDKWGTKSTFNSK
jgi:ubiquinone/menaquinone biosynthesis C-methylase UbiE